MDYQGSLHKNATLLLREQRGEKKEIECIFFSALQEAWFNFTERGLQYS